MRGTFTLDQQLVSMSPSIGIGLYPDDGDTGEALLRSADAAMSPSAWV